MVVHYQADNNSGTACGLENYSVGYYIGLGRRRRYATVRNWRFVTCKRCLRSRPTQRAC